MNQLKTLYDRVDALRARAPNAAMQISPVDAKIDAYSRVLGLINEMLADEPDESQCPAMPEYKCAPEHHYTDAEIQERLDTAGSHPHGDARDVEMLRQVFGELHRERRFTRQYLASSLLFTDSEKDAMAAVGVSRDACPVCGGFGCSSGGHTAAPRTKPQQD